MRATIKRNGFTHAKILVVLLAYALIYSISGVDHPYYFWVCGGAYALISIVASYAAIKTHSVLLYFYAVVNLLSALINVLMVNVAVYNFAHYWYWDAPINFHLIIELLELTLVINGAGHIAIAILRCFNFDRNSHKNGGFGSFKF